ncbi:hypothetical protein BST81_12865 [Leptolyngbya sp. 'hensonii']|uniref:PAS domain S-box protein n=1 Tax=Leptolyngbya sp. 'hensonii' TaxID=1922337 RepID=UPI00094FE92D|nr:PAS domain S-box protein [Leptolyngbya sp. 'hensonii']OLP17941.1 hypothetical protein BST81_12865 [Leptolyngbya sp. 'hensonii']
MFDDLTSSTILLVDDTPFNLQVLAGILGEAGFKVAVATDGESAIAQAEYSPPDLIFLDIGMPGLDGFATCRGLKANPVTQDIPVIFMTAVLEDINRVIGFNLGAVDYITQPFQAEEVLARVRIHLQFRHLTQQLKQQNQQLQQEIQDRRAIEADLRQANKQLQEEIYNRKQTTEALLHSEETNWALIQAIPDFLIRMRRDGTYLESWNHDRLENGLCLVEHEQILPGTPINQILPPDLLALQMHYAQEALATRQVQTYEQQAVVAGAICYEEVRITPCGEDEVLVIVRDITARKTTEIALAEREAEFRGIFSQAAVGIDYASLDGQFLAVNQKYCELLGYTDDELLTKTFIELTHPDDVEADLIASRQLIAGEIPFFSMEKRLLRQDGSYLWVDLTVSLIRGAHGEPKYLMAIVQDIHQRKQAEETLQSLVEGAAAVTGENFLPVMTEYLQKSLGIRHVVIAKRQTAEEQAYSVWLDGQLQPDLSGSLENSPCDVVIREGLYCCPSEVQQRFPDYPFLTRLNAESCLGIALTNNQGEIMGSLCIFDDQPLTQPQKAIGMLLVFAARASAELERQAALDALHQLNQELESRVEERTVELQRANLHLQQEMAERQKLVALVENSSDFIAIITLDGQLTYLNPAGRQLVGLDNTTALSSLMLLDFHFPENWAAIQHKMQLLSQGEVCQEEIQLRHFRTGQAIPSQCSAFAIKQAQTGEVVAFAAILRDITDRKLAEAALEESQRMLRLVLDTIPQRIFWKNRQSQYLGCNQICALDAGLTSPEQIIGKTDFELAWKASAADYQVDDQLVMELNQAKLHFEEGQQLEDGSYRWLRTSKIPLHNPRGEVIGVLGAYEDISDRKQAETVIQESEARYRRIVETAGEGIWVVDAHDYTTFVNEKMAQMLGLLPEQMLGRNLFDFMDLDAQQLAERYLAVHRQGMKEQYDFRFKRADGSDLWAIVAATPILDEEGHYIGGLRMVTDISDRKRAEAQLRRVNEQLILANADLAQATRLKDEFLANMSHELRTPLNAILGMSEGLQDRVLGNLNERQLKALSTIENSGRHLLDLINDILDLAKIESGKLELQIAATSVQNLCQSSLSFVRQIALKKSIHLDISIPTEIGPIMVDERRIRQVLINLLSNAVKFTPDSGRVTLRVKLEVGMDRDSETNRSHLSPAIAPASLLAFEVEDTGIGIASEDMPKLFRSFVQIDSSLNRQYSGTGLGLALVKHLVELHHGTVQVRSTVGQGSCFTITLPYQNAAQAKQTSTAPPNVPQGREQGAQNSEQISMRAGSAQPLILLAEDNAANVETLSIYLTNWGYELMIARTGREAVALAAAHRPDIILMDIQMPEMNGLEAIRQIRTIPELLRVPIIALTALVMPGDQEKCFQVGANEYLSKPVSLKHLANTICQLLNT